MNNVFHIVESSPLEIDVTLEKAKSIQSMLWRKCRFENTVMLPQITVFYLLYNEVVSIPNAQGAAFRKYRDVILGKTHEKSLIVDNGAY